jgi:ABC-type multidrug transport system fused ATPase/permease subunit
LVSRTVFIVAHRLSATRDVDRIYLIDGGSVAEQGSHDAPMAARGRYHARYSRQFGASGCETVSV